MTSPGSRNFDSQPFSENLITALQPIRQGVLAQIIFQLFDMGIYEAVTTHSFTPATLAHHLKARPDSIQVIIDYCLNEELLIFDNGILKVTKVLDSYAPFRPWFELLVGGYGATALGIADSATTLNDVVYCYRGMEFVTKGSIGISHYDTIPILRKILSRLSDMPQRVVDAGCGDASYLIEMCKLDDKVTCLGVEPNHASILVAHERIQKAGYGARIKIVNQSFQDHLQQNGVVADCYLFAFALQEIIAQIGKRALVEVLATLRQGGVNHLIVIEVDYKPNDPMMHEGLGRAYYNPYFLFHGFTRQTLMPTDEWIRLFTQAGYRVVSTDHPDEAIDPTQIEVCYLLSAYDSTAKE